MKTIVMLVTVLLLVACSGSDDPDQTSTNTIDVTQLSLEPDPSTGRWFTEQQVKQGEEIFATNCASCHGQNAESIPNWKSPDANGNFPPPPLNGTAHAWHHPLSVLKMVIEQGGAPVGGVMPAWGDTLSDEQIVNVIASFQSYWPDHVYQGWLTRERSSRAQQ